MKKSPIELAKFTDATLNRVLAAIKETIEVREGDRGDPRDRFVSVRDLQDSGVIVYTGAGANFQANPLPIRLQINLSKPPIPTGLVATGSFSNIFLVWDQVSFANPSHTEIFRATTNDRALSVSIGTALGLQFIDAVEPLTTYYYWIRFVSSAGREGDFNTGINSGTTGASLKTVSELISDMNDELSSSSFATSFLNTVNSVFSQLTEPTTKLDGRALVAGDLWFQNGVPNRYDGSNFVDASDPAIAVAQAAGDDAAALADKKVQIFHQTTEPVASATITLDVGDLWLNTSSDSNGDPKNILNRYSGTAWVVTQDSAIIIAKLAADNALAVADKKVQVFYDTTAPADNTNNALETSDLWLDISNDSNGNPKNILNRWSGTTWVAVQDSAILTAQLAANEAAALADKKVQIFYDTTAPADNANNALDTGDLWLDISNDSNGNPKNITNRWSGTTWVVVQDSGIGIAIGIAEGKTTIHYQDTQPTDAASELGDLWVDTNDNDSVYRRTGSATWAILGIATTAVVDSKIIEQVGVCMFTPTNTALAETVATGFTTKTTCEAASSSTGTYSWDNTGAIAQSLDVITSSVGTNTATITTQASSINGLNAQFTVKIDPNNGAVSGFGLASTTNNNTTTSEFYIRADKFGLINQADSNLSGVTSPFLVETDPAFSEKVFTVSGDRFPAAFTTQAQVDTANAALPSTSPFSYVFTAANTSIFLNGDAVIKRASIDSSVIKDLTVDKILRVPGEAFINEVDIEDASITSAMIKNFIESTNYTNTSAGYAGWRIDKNGSANFHDLTIRDSSGAILLSTGTGIDFTGITYLDIGGTKPPADADKTSSNVAASISGQGSLATQSSVAFSALTGSKPPADADKTSSNTAAGIAGQGSLATQSSVAFSALTGSKPPADADKTSSNTAAGIAGQGDFATVDKLVPDGAATTSLRRPISTFISDLAVDTLQLAGRAVTLPEGVYTNGAITFPNFSPQTIQTLSISNPNNFAVPYFVTFGTSFFLNQYPYYFATIQVALYAGSSIKYGYFYWGRQYSACGQSGSGGTIVTVAANATVSLQLKAAVYGVYNTSSSCSGRFIHAVGCQR